MAFKVQTASYGVPPGGGVLTEDTNAIAYRCRWVMNAMSEATVTLNDPNFASTQKYTATAAGTYLGYGTGTQITIEDPVNTEIFDGWVTKVTSQPRDGTVLLHCKDLLYQLSGPRIVYDTRADLDGSGLRQSVPYRMANNYEHGIYDDTAGGGNYLLYDTVAGWSNGDFHGGDQYYLLFSGKMAQKQDIWHGVDEGTVSGTDVTEVAGDADNTWFAEDGSWQLQSTNAGDDWTITLPFTFNVPYTAITQVDVEIHAFGDDSTDCDGPFTVQVYNHRRSGSGLAAGYYSFAYLEGGVNMNTGAPATQFVYTDIGELLTSALGHPGDLLGADNDVDLKIVADAKAAAKADLWLVLLRVTVHLDGITANSTAYTIDEDGDNYIGVSEDLVTADIDKHSPYMLTKVITKYVADLGGTYDTGHALDWSSDLTASTNTCPRHFHYMTPLTILQHLAGADGTEFWLDDGDDVHWNDPFTVAGAPNITDSDVLTWRAPVLSLDHLGNDIVVLGQRYDDAQITGTASDANSQTYYGKHTRVDENPGVYTESDADAYATTLKDRYKDPVFNIGYAVNGLSTYDVGTVLEIDSTNLNLTDQYYIITEKRYSSRTGVTEFTLTKRSTDGLFEPLQWEDGTRRVQADVGQAKRHQDFRPLHTETWS